MEEETADERIAAENLYNPSYQICNDFIHDNIQIVWGDNTNIHLTLREAYSAFKYWYGDTYSNNRYPDCFYFHNGMKEKFGPLIDGKWLGIWIRNQEIDGF